MIMERNGFTARGGPSKTYKIARLAARRDAKRHHIANIIAENDDDAIEEFIDYVALKDDNKTATYKLYSGDWSREIVTFH